MFNVSFMSGITKLVSGYATLRTLHDMVQEHGQITVIKPLKDRRPQAFDVADVTETHYDFV